MEATMPIIAMTREMGTLGKDVAREFAERTGYAVLHHELVEDARDRERRHGESEVYRFLEGGKQELDKWRNARVRDGYMTPEEVFELALEGNALIRGWGAPKLLKSVPNVLAVRVCAPMEFRIEQMQERLGVDARTARREITRSDAAHSRTFLNFFDVDWYEPVNYDIVLNTAHLSPRLCADILVDAVSNPVFQDGPETRRELTDRMLEARIRSAFRSDRELDQRGLHVRVSVENSEARLYGVVSDSVTGRRAEELASAQAGLVAVRNELVRAYGFE
jgi:cytidylate kinase